MVSEHLPSIFAQWSPVNSPGWYHQSYARPSVAENSLLCPLTGRGRPWHGGPVDHSAPGASLSNRQLAVSFPTSDRG
ncbi:Tnf Receptor-Associated Factor 1 [Manis pentadactyla]|nr:Tnf Receptor-Associated Factor 1 [Manis pentadactyla]